MIILMVLKELPNYLNHLMIKKWNNFSSSMYGIFFLQLFLTECKSEYTNIVCFLKFYFNVRYCMKYGL